MKKTKKKPKKAGFDPHAVIGDYCLHDRQRTAGCEMWEVAEILVREQAKCRVPKGFLRCVVYGRKLHDVKSHHFAEQRGYDYWIYIPDSHLGQRC